MRTQITKAWFKAGSAIVKQILKTQELSEGSEVFGVVSAWGASEGTPGLLINADALTFSAFILN